MHSQGNCFLTGADLSYSNEILRKGGSYFDMEGLEVDPYNYFADQGCKIVRLRLWHTPSNVSDFCGGIISSSSLEDVLDAAMKVKQAGMQLKLSIHYSDYFVDPGRQKMPASWLDLSHPELIDSIRAYTNFVLNKLKDQNTIPEIVSVGNETTWGFVDRVETTDGFDWEKDIEKFNSALEAISTFNENNTTNIKSALHFTESTVNWATNEFRKNGIADYDLIGFSYYPSFSPSVGMEDIGKLVSDLSTEYEKEVMIFETGFAWTSDFSDGYNNFIGNNGTTIPYPQSQSGQKDFLLDLAEIVESNQGIGVIYWEPSWITSSLCDQWGQGSSYENVTMFHTENQQALSAFDFFEYCSTSGLIANENSQEVSIFPNPTYGSKVMVSGASVYSKWEIYDTSGARVKIGVFVDKTGEVRLDHLPRGLYFLALYSDAATKPYINRFIIH